MLGNLSYVEQNSKDVYYLIFIDFTIMALLLYLYCAIERGATKVTVDL